MKGKEGGMEREAEKRRKRDGRRRWEYGKWPSASRSEIELHRSVTGIHC